LQCRQTLELRLSLKEKAKNGTLTHKAQLVEGTEQIEQSFHKVYAFACEYSSPESSSMTPIKSTAAKTHHSVSRTGQGRVSGFDIVVNAFLAWVIIQTSIVNVHIEYFQIHAFPTFFCRSMTTIHTWLRW
jgi:hypothetical protein